MSKMIIPDGTTELTCIGCPKGCLVSVTIENGEIKEITGNSCQIGYNYASAEVTDPRRTLTSSIKVNGGELAMVSVKTASDIPKGLLLDAMKVIKAAVVTAPVSIGDVLIENILDTGVDVVATSNVPAR